MTTIPVLTTVSLFFYFFKICSLFLIPRKWNPDGITIAGFGIVTDKHAHTHTHTHNNLKTRNNYKKIHYIKNNFLSSHVVKPTQIHYANFFHIIWIFLFTFMIIFFFLNSMWSEFWLIHFLFTLFLFISQTSW